MEASVLCFLEPGYDKARLERLYILLVNFIIHGGGYEPTDMESHRDYVTYECCCGASSGCGLNEPSPC
jgi:hypothetical protein